MSRKKYSLVYALSGVHGTISLAIALSLPTTMVSGESFFFRQEMIFVAAFDILISIVVPAIVFPKLLEKKK
ncbi:MAG: hypothetical protein PUC65_13925 [Clostridiales bacterium]|nr:hypothetical protein [Clostridiales bacterium]